jgi:hypothetical protein
MARFTNKDFRLGGLRSTPTAAPVNPDKPCLNLWIDEPGVDLLVELLDDAESLPLAKRTAVALAKAMIRDGRMPTPEEAERQLTERQRQHVSLSLDLKQDKEPIPVTNTTDN